MKLDPAIAKLLGLDAAGAKISASGHGTSAASTQKITAQLSGGSEKSFFMKTLDGKDGPLLVEGEHASLCAMHDAVPDICPQSLGWGMLQDTPSRSFLVVEFLDLSRSSSSSKTRSSLAQKLAKMHTTPAPIPQGYSEPQFGFPVTTCCGDSPQDNSFKARWAEFYAENRLRSILRRCEAQQGKDAGLRKMVEATASTVVAHLLSDERLNGGRGVAPVVVHGDLWSGNAASGSINGGPVDEFIYDPSACYAHSEFDLGIMRMFGGFGASFLAEYHKHCPKTEPVDEYDDRVRLYELYHHLNHYAIFGGHYKAGAMGIMKELLQKYGSS